jgi:hypothetical protein
MAVALARRVLGGGWRWRYGRDACFALAIVAVGQVQKPLLDEWVGLGRDIANFPGPLPVKILVHGNRIFLKGSVCHFFPTNVAPASSWLRTDVSGPAEVLRRD